MQEPQDLIYYVHEDKVKDQVKDEDYEQHAINYKVKGYKKEQKQLKNKWNLSKQPLIWMKN